MKRLLVVVPALALSASCAPRYDLFLAWTVDGEEAASACSAVKKAKIEAHVGQRDSEDGAAVDEHFDLVCKDGAGSIASASFSDVTLDLMSGDSLWGHSETSAAAPGASEDYVGNTAENPLTFDIHVTKSRIHARLTVVGQSCGDAEVSAFTVTLSKLESPLNEVVVEGQDDVSVSCEDGEAYYEYGAADVGTTYKLAATAVLNYATDGTGVAITAAGPLTEATVDLVPTE